METSLKTSIAQISLAAPQNLSCPKFGGPPACTPMTEMLIQ